MFPNEYLNREHHKDLLREAEHMRLGNQAVERIARFERLGWLLLRWGARLTAPQRSTDPACRSVQNEIGQTVTVCVPA